MESFRFHSEMYCELLVEEKLAETAAFLSQHEERCITLMSRLVKNGMPVMPEENLSVLVFRHSKESSVCAVVSYSESGFILHCIPFSEDYAEIGAFMKDFLSGRSLFCILGEKKGSDLLIKAAGRSPTASIDYTLMTFGGASSVGAGVSSFSGSASRAGSAFGAASVGAGASVFGGAASVCASASRAGTVASGVSSVCAGASAFSGSASFGVSSVGAGASALDAANSAGNANSAGTGLPIPPGFTCVPCSEADVNLLLPLQKEYDSVEVLLPGAKLDVPLCRLNLRKILREQFVLGVRADNADSGFFVAKAGTNAIGLNWVQLGGVCTLPEYRGKGLAAFLVNKIALQKLSDGKKTALFVKNKNLPAQKAYKKAGFVPLCPFSISYF